MGNCDQRNCDQRNCGKSKGEQRSHSERWSQVGKAGWKEREEGVGRPSRSDAKGDSKLLSRSKVNTTKEHRCMLTGLVCLSS